MDKFKGAFRPLLKGKFFIEEIPDHLLLYFTFLRYFYHHITDYAAYFINFVYLSSLECKLHVAGIYVYFVPCDIPTA